MHVCIELMIFELGVCVDVLLLMYCQTVGLAWSIALDGGGGGKGDLV